MSEPVPASEVEAALWCAIAGASVQIPTVNSRVYYFPQGHLEHSSASASAPFTDGNYVINLQCPVILCQVLAIRFLSDPISDQAFVRIALQPIHPGAKDGSVNFTDDDQNNVVSFAKTLTPSDANNGGGFSVPKFCADLIFPRLNFAADPPVQNLIMKDTQNNAWEFRHIYRGTPRRHLFTTGWSKFVNCKNLVAGDSVVFMKKKATNELFIGVRRGVRDGVERWESNNSSLSVKEREALEAIEMAAKGMAFEVVYYPRAGLPDFIVIAEKVENALRMCWSEGMRVKIAVDTEDSSRMTWFQGTISTVTLPECGPWCCSPWRMLQVTWDEPPILPNINRVSPWQVEYVLPAPQFHTPILPPKKFKALQNPEMLPNGDEESCLPLTDISNSITGHLNPSIFNYNNFSYGMQGARQDQIYISTLPSSRSDNSYQTFTDFPKNDLRKSDMEPELKTVSTVLNIGSSLPDNLSPGSQSSVHFCSTDLVGQQWPNSSSNVGSNSFQLFGKIIQMPKPVEGGSKNNVSCTDGDEVFKDSNNAVNNEPNPPLLKHACMN